MRCYLRREKRQIQVLIAISEMIIVSNLNNNYYTNEWDCKNIKFWSKMCIIGQNMLAVWKVFNSILFLYPVLFVCVDASKNLEVTTWHEHLTFFWTCCLFLLLLMFCNFFIVCSYHEIKSNQLVGFMLEVKYFLLQFYALWYFVWTVPNNRVLLINK